MIKTKHKKQSYKEGDWFAIPLKDGGYAVGLIARMKPRTSVLFGYFFGPRMSKMPTDKDISRYNKNNAIFVGKFGDLSLFKNKWKIICNSKNWDRKLWPMPPFTRIDPLTQHIAFKSWYSEDNPNQLLKEQRCDSKEAKKFLTDSLYGAGAVEIELNELLK